MPKLQTVWRIENEAGEGPYKGHVASYITDNYDCNIHAHPGPRDETQPIRDLYDADEISAYKFGFKSLAAAKVWFYKAAARQYLDREGYRLVKYRVSTRVVGQKQVVFRMRDKHLIKVDSRLVASL